MKGIYTKIFLFIVLSSAAAYVYVSNNYQIQKESTTTQQVPTTPEKGTVTGRLCYPSDFLPKGTIVAKNVDTNNQYTQEYPGSFAGGAMTYVMELEAGKYYLKYVAVPNPKSSTLINGYHTELCKTGGETSCAQENKRKNVAINITSGQTVSNVDLCDFYYAQNDEPKF